MQESLQRRSNDAWIDALRGVGDHSSEAVQELSCYLERVLARMFSSRFSHDDVADLVQESLARVLRSLDSFRGDSAFSTWATGIATRVAFTELRRRSMRSTRSFEELQEEARQLASPLMPPEGAASRSDLLGALEIAIATRLTDRQRLAILAELRGVSTVEISKRLQTNQNALYKLTHDARRKLKAALGELGFGAESIHELTSERSL